MMGFKSSSTKYVICGLILLAVIGKGSSFPQKEDDYLSDDETNYDDSENEHSDTDNGGSSMEQHHPYFDVKGVNQSFIPNKDVILTCPVKDLGSHFVIVWYKGTDTIATGGTPLKTNYAIEGEMDQKTKLRIKSATESDAGVYRCNIQPKDISVNITLMSGEVDKIVLDEIAEQKSNGNSGASIVSSYSALLAAAFVTTVFLRI